MAPIVIVFPAVVVAIALAVALGLRHIKKSERADLAAGPAGRSQARTSREDAWRTPRPNPAARGQVPKGTAGSKKTAAPKGTAGPKASLGSKGPARPAREPDPPGGRSKRDSTERDLSGQRPEKAQRSAPAPSDQDAEVVQLKGRPGKQARAKRNSDDGDWPSTEWDDLSDADYWKEVASDRPLVTTARTAQPASRPDDRELVDLRPREKRQLSARQAQDAQTVMQPSVPARGQDPQHDHAPMPPAALPQRAAAGYGPGFLGASPASLAQEPLTSGHYQPQATTGLPAPPAADRGGVPSGRLPGAFPPPAAPPSVVPAPAARPPLPQLYDDDPLTSPSFPRIVTSDSRSYRGSRSAAASAPSPAPQAPRAADLPGYGGAPTAQFPRYGPAAPGSTGSSGPVNGGDAGGYLPATATGSTSATAPHSYSPNPGALPAAASDSYRSDSYGTAGQAGGYGHASQDIHPYSSPRQVNGYGQASQPSQDAGYRSQAHDSQAHDPARYAPATPSAAATPDTGNPYGSYVGTDSYSSGTDSYGSSDAGDDYVSTDLPGYTPNLAASYAPEQRGGYLPGAAGGQATSHASDPYERGGPTPSYAQAPTASYEIPAAGSWYPGPGGSAAELTRPASGSHHAPSELPGGSSLDQAYSNGYPIPPGYGPPTGYAGRHHDAPSYAPAGHDAPGSTPGYLPAGSYPADRQDSSGYLPPDYYGREDPARP